MTTIAPWTLKLDSGDIRADFLDGPLYSTSPGAEISPTFVFVSGGIDDLPGDRHADLQPLVDAAVDGTTIRTGRNRTAQPYYREDLSGFSGVDSLLVALVPDSGRGGVWAVLRAGSDGTPAVERDVFVWELELTVLERYDDGDVRGDLENEYKDEVQ